MFLTLYLFGAFSPIDGDSFLLELPNCNTENFQEYLNEFSQHRPLELKIIVLDNGAFHKSSILQIPDNILLLFLPPYSPELNPAENIWAFFKRQYNNKLMKSLDDVSSFITQSCKILTSDKVMKTCRFNYIFSSNVWTI